MIRFRDCYSRDETSDAYSFQVVDIIEQFHPVTGRCHVIAEASLSAGGTFEADADTLRRAECLLRHQQLLVDGQVPSGHLSGSPALPTAQRLPRLDLQVHGAGTISQEHLKDTEREREMEAPSARL